MNLVKITKRKIQEIPALKVYFHFTHLRLRHRDDYLKILKNWLSAFPREQLYVGFFEGIKERLKQLLTDIFRYIGFTHDISREEFPYSKVIYKGVGAPMPQAHRNFLKELYCEEIERLYKYSDLPMDRWLSKSN